MKRFMLWVAASCAAIFLLTGCATGPSYTKADPGLQETRPGNLDFVLLPPDGRIPAFSRVYIEDPEVTMNRQWLTTFRSQYSNADLTSIDRDYGQLLKRSLTRGMEQNSAVVVVESADQADMIFRPHLLNLNIYAPDLMLPPRRSYYTREAGNATLDLHLVDANTGRVVAQFVDHRETSAGIMLRGQRANRVTNTRYFGRMMDRWSTHVADYLIDAGSIRESE
jgi:hypothetical protein